VLAELDPTTPGAGAPSKDRTSVGDVLREVGLAKRTRLLILRAIGRK
jgi:hypothetical protein